MSQQAPWAKQSTVLVVDDEVAIVKVLRDFLEAEGFGVLMARDGVEALATLARERVDCLLLDIMMPGPDGFDVCRQIRATTDVPILFLTAREGDSDKLRGFRLGADDYIVKSATPDEIVARVKAVLRRARPPAAAKEIALALDGPDEPCPLLGEAHLLARVVENLLDNAVRHTPAGGQIQVRWGSVGAMLRFTVADSGPGLAEQDLPHLFTPLYRGETSRNRQTGGAGLGLAIAWRILRAHGGDLSAANSPAGGAVFTGTLPATLRPQPISTATASPA